MAIQILGLRSYQKNGKYKIAEKFFEKGWRCESVPDLFENIEKYISAIPEKERYNLFYTVADCFETKGRKLKKQNIIPYDIDGIDTARIDEYITPILAAIGDIEFGHTGIVYSGNGLQFLIETDIATETEEFFEQNKIYYNVICNRINASLRQKKLPGKADTSVFSTGRLMRLPETKNIKTPETGYPNKNLTKDATLKQRIMTVQKGYDLKKVAGMPDLTREDYTPHAQNIKLGAIDTPAVLDECLFLQECKKDPENVSEENWYKMLSIVGVLQNGAKIAHEYSREYKGYDFDETQEKLDQALNSSGPRTCVNVEKSFSKCNLCPHYKKILNPTRIKSEEFIASELTGFRFIKRTSDDKPIPGKPAYDDLLKYFNRQHQYICLSSKILYVYNGVFWDQESDSYIESFVEKHLNPKPTNSECHEFKCKVYRTNIKDKEFFSDTTKQKINLRNGVLDLSEGSVRLLEHSTDFGFLSVLPYNYDPEAACPRFDLFMEEITLKRPDLIKVLLEFAGYAFAGESCKHAKALLLLGATGANGKSTFIWILQKLAGRTAYSSVPLNRFDNDQYLAQLQGKLFNLTEETPSRAFADSSVFKNLVTGGDITVKVVYKEPYLIENKAKIILACNELPWLKDTTGGMMRRLLIVPFGAKFEGNGEDKEIREVLEYELPGILNRIIEAYKRLRFNNGFTQSKMIEREKEKYMLASDAVYRFHKEALVYNKVDFLDKPDEFCTGQEVYEAYRRFCFQQGETFILPKIGFFMKLNKYVPQSKERRKRRGALKETIYLGVFLDGQPEY